LALFFAGDLPANEIKYDENTEIIANGTVTKTILNSSFNPSENWNYFALTSPGKKFVVITAPHWYLKKINMSLMDGTPVSVVGSKFVINEKISYILAKSIKSHINGKFFLFRDKNGNPLWEVSGVSEFSCIENKARSY
jgi:hypothetical protein